MSLVGRNAEKELEKEIVLEGSDGKCEVARNMNGGEGESRELV